MNWARFAANTWLRPREPISLVLFVTGRCNARCRHCFIDFGNRERFGSELSLEEIGKIAGTLGRSVFNINLTGGEPFLREDLGEILSVLLARTPVRAVVITTNGTRPDRVRDLLERFGRERTGAVLKISVSVDHLGERHDANRGLPGAFARAMETYRLADAWPDKRVLADVALTVTPQNAGDMAQIHAGLAALGVRHCAPILLRESGVVTEIADRERVLAGYLALRELTDAAADRHAGIPASRHELLERLKRGKNAVVTRILAENFRAPACHARCVGASLFGVVYPNGDVFPCEILAERWKLGNLREEGLDLGRVWRGDRAAAARRFIRESRCACTFECALSTTVTARPRLALRALGAALRRR